MDPNYILTLVTRIQGLCEGTVGVIKLFQCEFFHLIFNFFVVGVILC